MNITITGKEIKATEAIKDYVEKKLSRIEKYFKEEDLNVDVTIKAEKNSQIAEMHVTTSNDVYRAVTEDKDLYASIDKDIDVLEGQIRKAKTKKEKMTKDGSLKTMEVVGEKKGLVVEDEVIKVLYYDVKPLSVDDAKLKLQEKPNNIFMPFINVETGKVNVIHRLKDGKNYGLVEPEA